MLIVTDAHEISPNDWQANAWGMHPSNDEYNTKDYKGLKTRSIASACRQHERLSIP